MTYRIDTFIDIAADAHTVWRVLMDFPAYPQWNPFIKSISGLQAPGGRLRVSIAPPGKAAMRFRPTIKEHVEQRKFAWLGHLLLPKIFDGLHEFALEPTTAGVRFVHRETFSGLLVPLLWKNLEPATAAGFAAMNQALKLRAEALQAGA